jgi:hypothetical protein
MTIQLNRPYKIIPLRHKRYDSHYNIPSSDAVVIPMKELGEEVLCDIRWRDANGELHALSNCMFVKENLIPLNEMLDDKLFDIWSQFYSPVSNTQG